jgi:hypothetical protein
MSDRRYRTAAWRKTRAYVIARDRRCMVEGPKCNGFPQTAHHTLPTSQYPELFFDVRYIVAACLPCNQHGGETKAENRANRTTIAYLERQLDEAHARIAELENDQAKPSRRRVRPAIR